MIVVEWSWSVVCAMHPRIVVNRTFMFNAKCQQDKVYLFCNCIFSGGGGEYKYLYHQNFQIVWQNRIVSWLWFEVSATY